MQFNPVLSPETTLAYQEVVGLVLLTLDLHSAHSLIVKVKTTFVYFVLRSQLNPSHAAAQFRSYLCWGYK
jgi:hypothetical protein